jgi:hypothetical protein
MKTLLVKGLTSQLGGMFVFHELKCDVEIPDKGNTQVQQL